MLIKQECRLSQPKMRTISLLLQSSLLILCRGVEEGIEYGTDVSYPMHYPNVSNNYAWLPHNVDPKKFEIPEEQRGMPIQPFGDRQHFYNENIQGCIDYYGDNGQRCRDNEKSRINMNLRQPQSMVNYTKMGFTKIRAPEEVFRLLKEFWESNRHKGNEEKWGIGNTYTNHWKTKTLMVSVEDNGLKGAGFELKQGIWDAARSTIEEWTGMRLAECSLYGIRVYQEGAVLATHVDRNPLVSSAIINVDQDLDEPWPLEVIGHDGKAHNVTMVPGDLVLYESHSILHGRPFPLKGRFMANIFVHFEPINPMSEPEIRVNSADLPPYIVRGSPEEKEWRRRNLNGWKAIRGVQITTGQTDAHYAALSGNTQQLEKLLDEDPKLLNAKDSHGWTVLHEAIRGQRSDVVRLLVTRGADVNAVTSDGHSVLHFARRHSKNRNHNNAISFFLQSYGAQEIEPDL